MPKVNRINVVFLYVQDLALMRYFYEQVFELGKPLIDAKWWVEYAVGDGSHLALHKADALHFQGVDRQKTTVKFSFDVTDIDEYLRRLTKHGAKVHFGPRQEYGFYLAEFEDPEGNVVRLYQKTNK
jgi:predicted enzyme related to lactoylglutathione lyase